jgi:hypothetical protein
VLDVAREQVAGAVSAESSEPAPVGEDGAVGDDDEDDDDDDDAAASAPAELPAPDPSSFTGARRVVNLFAEPTGDGAAPGSVDVWGRRTFTNGPVLLAEDIGFGEASEYFAAPDGYRLVIVSSRAGPDGEERATLTDAADDEQVTIVFTNADDATTATASRLSEGASDRAPAPPADDRGLVVLFAPNLPAFGDGLVASVGGDTFAVGDGSATCRTQRVETTGAAAEVLGGAAVVELEAAPGPTLISLHPLPSPDGCDQPSAVDVTVDVVAGEVTTVLVYTADGTTLETLALTPGG